jgi:hypothetical protein
MDKSENPVIPMGYTPHIMIVIVKCQSNCGGQERFWLYHGLMHGETDFPVRNFHAVFFSRYECRKVTSAAMSGNPVTLLSFEKKTEQLVYAIK